MRNCMIRLQYTMQRCHTLEVHTGRECHPTVTENARWKSACRVHLRAASSCLSLDAGTQLSVWGPSPPHLPLHCRASILMEPVSSSPRRSSPAVFIELADSPHSALPLCRYDALPTAWLVINASKLLSARLIHPRDKLSGSVLETARTESLHSSRCTMAYVDW